MSRHEYFDLYEHFDSPAHPDSKGWVGYEQFEYRVSWRLHKAVDGKILRNFRTCFEDDIDVLLPQIEEFFGKPGPNARWDFNEPFMYLFFRTKADAMEFRLRIDLPK